MEVEPFKKGSTVEVSSDEEGFYGAWYVATLVDIVDTSPTKTRASKRNKDKKKVGYLVSYATLFNENNHTDPLMEIVDPLYVRPLPPRDPRRDNGNQAVAEAETETDEGNAGGGGDFQVNDVVDAYLRDGWWIGVVRKLIADGEMKKYSIYFENPPEEVEFEGSQMRLHVDWINSRWEIPPQETPKQDSADKNVTQTSESNNESNNGSPSDVITPSKRDSVTESSYLTISSRFSAKKKSHPRKKAVTNFKKIAAVDGSVKYHRTRRVVNFGEEEEDSHENFQSSACVEKTGSKGNNTEDMVSMIETNGAEAKNKKSPRLEKEMINKETCETPDGNSQLKRKSGRLIWSQSERLNGSLEDNQERDSSGIDEITTDLVEQPLSVWYQELHPGPVFKKNSCSTALEQELISSPNPTMVNHSQTTLENESIGAPNPTMVNHSQATLEHELIGASNPTMANHSQTTLEREPIGSPSPNMVNDRQTTENNNVLPFVKRSPIWAILQSLELYRKSSQNPHFSPLLKTKEDYREGMAIAHMVTFSNVVQRTTSLQWTDPSNVIKNSLETLVDLEANGFDVGSVRVRLDELLTKKCEAGRLEGEMKEVEKEVEKCNSEKKAIDEEIDGLKRKMRELEEKMAVAVAMKKVKDEEDKVVRTKLEVVSKRILDWKMAFEELSGTPL